MNFGGARKIGVTAFNERLTGWMKSAFCKGEALQEEIRRACKEGWQKIWWLGQSGFLWVQNGRGILFDPSCLIH